MSLILDALNRSRADAAAVPGIATVHGSDVPPARRPWPLWLALAAALLACGWLLWDRGGETPAAPAPVAVAPPPAGKPTAVVPPPVVTPTPVTEPAPANPRTAEAPAAGPDPAVAALYQQPVAEPRATPAQRKPAPVAKAEPVDVETMVREVQQELANSGLAEHPAPFLTGLSQSVKDRIPTLIYQRHEYSDRPGQSRVVINSESLVPGGNTRGVRVTEILADSVVLDYEGTQFRLRALNSWVNL